MLLPAFKIGQNSHPVDCPGKSYGFAISWYLSYLFVMVWVSPHLKETDVAIFGECEKVKLGSVSSCLVLCREQK